MLELELVTEGPCCKTLKYMYSYGKSCIFTFNLHNIVLHAKEKVFTCHLCLVKNLTSSMFEFQGYHYIDEC